MKEPLITWDDCRVLDTRSHDDHWTKCRHPETAHNTVSSYDCTFDDLELVHQSLRTLEPRHTHKFPRVNAQDSKLGPIQPWDVKDFLGEARVRP